MNDNGILDNKNTYFEDSKFNSFDSIAVSFNGFIEATASEKEHMLCYPISDRGDILDSSESFKVFLSDNAPSAAQGILDKCRTATIGKSCFILDRVSRIKGSDKNLECGWINVISKNNATTILSGVAFIQPPEREHDEEAGN